MPFTPFKYLGRTAASIAPLLLAMPFIAATASATTYNIVDPTFKTIGTLTATAALPTKGNCSNNQNGTSYYVQTVYTFTSYSVNGVVEGGTLKGSGSTNSAQVTYTIYNSGPACSYPAAGSSAVIPLPGATLDGQSYFKIGYKANFTGPSGFAYIDSPTLPLFNTAGTIIGSVGSGFATSFTSNCGSGTTYKESLFLLASRAADGSYNGGTFEGGGPLYYSNGTYTDNYIQYLSAPTSGCQPSGFVNTSAINLPFGSGSNVYINGVQQSNPQSYSVEFNGTSSANLQ